MYKTLSVVLVSLMLSSCAKIVIPDSKLSNTVDILKINLGNDISIDESINTASFSTRVPIGINSITINSIVVEPSDATIKINDISYTNNTSISIPLELGTNEINIVASYQNESKTYKLVVKRLLSETTYLKASDSNANDYYGVAVSIEGDTVAVSSDKNSGFVYLYNTDANGNYQETAKLSSPSTNPDRFGYKLDISGSILAVSDPYENSYRGVVYLFEQSNGVWHELTSMSASNADNNDEFGKSLAIDGNILVVGAPNEASNGSNPSDNSLSHSGAAYIFEKQNNAWVQTAYLKAQNPHVNDEFGVSVAVDNGVVAVGAHGDDNIVPDSGAVYIFEKQGGVWTQTAYLKASDPSDTAVFGASVSIESDILVVGAPAEKYDTNTWSGSAYIYKKVNGSWNEVTKLTATYRGHTEVFGYRVKINNGTVLIAAPGDDSSSTGINGEQDDYSSPDSGAIYTFKQDTDGSWVPDLYIKATNTDSDDEFGYSVDINSGTIVVGAMHEASNSTEINGDQSNNDNNYSGAVYIYK